MLAVIPVLERGKDTHDPTNLGYWCTGGMQGATGRRVAELLLERGIPVRAFVRKLDARSDGLREIGAEVVEGNLLDPASVHAAMKGVKRAYFTYPVRVGLLEATTIFASAAQDAGVELVVNNSQFKSVGSAPTFRNLQHRLGESIFDWARVGAVHLEGPPYYEGLCSLISRPVADQDTRYTFTAVTQVERNWILV